ncbi:MAG: general secretion pathway protein GspK [Bdellovibrionota bacterium]
MRNQRGVAMLMALITMFVLAIIAGELVYQSGVYSSVVFRARDQLRASLLARSGLRLALLQVRATKKAKAKAKAMGLGDNASVVDKIWQTPMILPPPDIPGLAPSDTATLEAFRTSLGLEGTVNVTILGENGRMGINQLVWPPSNPNDVAGVSKGGTRLDPNNPLGPPPGTPVPNGQSATEQLTEAKKKVHDSYVEIFNNMLEKKRQDDDSFRDKYANVTGEQMVGNILAWMDPNTQNDGDGRDKNDFYSRAEPSPYMPKNAPIANSSEYHMIKNLDETLFKLVDDNFTVQNANSLDVNKASLLLIHSLIPDLTPDALERIGKRRTDDTLGGPFKDANDFWTFLGTLGSYDDAKKKLTANGITILDPDSTYHAVITANSGVATKMWLADIGPMPPKDPLSTATNTATATAQPVTTTAASNGSSTSTSTNTSTSDSSDLDSLSVVYLKSE